MKIATNSYQKFFLVVAIICSSIAISIRSKDRGVVLVLGDYPLLIFGLIMLSTFLVVMYFKAQHRKIEEARNQIEEQSKDDSDDFKQLLHQLTDRQREVYDLIILGKSNKEIKATLFIEQSTLKTHINQIYKKLNIKNRKELKSKSNP